MKKTLLVAMTLFVATVAVLAQPSGPDYWKMAKKKAKTEAKAGWLIDGSKTLEVALYEHYQKQNNDGNYEIVGNVIGTTTVKTVNQGQQWATTNAAISYSKQAGMMVRGRINAAASAGIEDPSVDRFIEGYEALVQKEIRGELIKSFGMYREKADGTLEYKAYFVISEDAANKARMRALENLKKESEFARERADEISEFVREGFQPTAE